MNLAQFVVFVVFFFFLYSIKTLDLCNEWFKLYSASVQIQSESCQQQMATFPHAEKNPILA